jgi:hypothetical protein
VSLRAQAAVDARAIVGDASAFACPTTLTDPGGHTAAVNGLTTDVHTTIDPNTGMVVSGRKASVAYSLAALTAAGFASVPKQIASQSSKPWVVVFADITGASHTFKVAEGLPDAAIGIVVCMLEAYVGP